MNVDTEVGDDDLLSPRSSSDASGSTSPYRRRFNKQTRREALEQRFGRLRGRGGAKSLRQSLKGGSVKDEDDRSTHMTNTRTSGAVSATSEDNHSCTGSVSTDSNESHHLNVNNEQLNYGLNEADQSNGGGNKFMESRYHFIPIPKNVKEEAASNSATGEGVSTIISQKGDINKGRPQQTWAPPSVIRPGLHNFAPSSSSESVEMKNRAVEKTAGQPHRQVVGRYAPNTAETEPENTAPKAEKGKTSFVMQRAQEFAKLSNLNSDSNHDKQKPKSDGSTFPSQSITSKFPILPQSESNGIAPAPTEMKLVHLRSQMMGKNDVHPNESPRESKVPKVGKNENSIVMLRAQAFGSLSGSQHEATQHKRAGDSIISPHSDNTSTGHEVIDTEDHPVISPRGALVAQRALAFENLAKKIPEPPFRKSDGQSSLETNGVVAPNLENDMKESAVRVPPVPAQSTSAPDINHSLPDDSGKSNTEKAPLHETSAVIVPKQVEEYCTVKAMLRPVSKIPRPENNLLRPGNPRQIIFYRIVYKGVVALLSEPSTSSPRSGAYVSYGEYIASRYEVEVDDGDSTAFDSTQSPRAPSKRLDFKVRSPGGFFDAGQCASPESPPRSVLSQTSLSISSLETARRSTVKAVRVDEVLTGGYAVDAVPLVLEPAAETPRRSNTQFGPILGPSPLPIPDSQSHPSHNDAGLAELSDEHTHMGVRHHGFLFTHRRDLTIAEEVTNPPVCDKGRFLYKVISSTPLPILTGPCSDAPKTKAMLLPGTIHEVCLKLTHDQQENQVCFLRLSHRKGWIPDRKASPGGGPLKLLMVPMDNGDSHEDGSLVSNSVASQSNASVKRHRLPRRRQDAENTSFDNASAPGTPARKPMASSEASRRTVSHVPDQNTPNTSSNLSMLSDDSSIDHASSHRIAAVVASPDRSVARSSTSAAPSSSMIYLMRVTAPQGLKILDAPQFQVNNLIHGKQEGSSVSSVVGRDPKSVSYMKTNQSVFQSQTSMKGSNGSPAVFDSISKSRRLPRNVYFEASTQMECFEAFNQGLGLIKLADGSGWAIVPTQEELDEQYRKYHGVLANVKEGDTTRAFEEVGNAIVEYPENRCVWLRVLPKTGLPVSCPPPSPLAHEPGGSPTASSVGEGSSVGGGSNFGVLRDSEVASAVGSVILDAMFRTPKKRDGDSGSVDNPGVNAPPKIIVAGNEDAILPCGLCVEVDRWKESTDPSDLEGVRQASTHLNVSSFQLFGWS